jgi:hypothetical protein
MKNIYKLLFLALVVLSLSSCLATRTSSVAMSKPMNANFIRLDLKMEDFQLLGEEKLTVVYRKYFSFYNFGGFTYIDSINGVPYDRYNVKTIRFNSFSPFSSLASKAIAPLIEKYPNADFISQVSSTNVSHVMFGGNKNKLTIYVKFYKFK